MPFFKPHKKISAKTLIGLKQYIDKFFPGENGPKSFFRESKVLHKRESNYKYDNTYSGAAYREEDYGELFESSAEVIKEPEPENQGNACPFPAAAESIPKARRAPAAKRPEAASASLSDALSQLDESFANTLMRKIDEKNMTDAQCYKKAQIDRKLFSKIRSRPDYRPSKQTAISFALALELSLPETNDLLMKAGYALSHSSKADVIIEYFILHSIYDKFQINEALYEFDQPLI